MRISGRRSNCLPGDFPRRIYARAPPGSGSERGDLRASVNRELCDSKLRLCPCLCEGAVKGYGGPFSWRPGVDP